MKERILLFNNEIERFKTLGWPYEVFYQDKKEGIYLVEADIPDEIMKKYAEHKDPIPQSEICPHCSDGLYSDFDEDGCLYTIECSECKGKDKLQGKRTKG